MSNVFLRRMAETVFPVAVVKRDLRLTYANGQQVSRVIFFANNGNVRLREKLFGDFYASRFLGRYTTNCKPNNIFMKTFFAIAPQHQSFFLIELAKTKRNIKIANAAISVAVNIPEIATELLKNSSIDQVAETLSRVLDELINPANENFETDHSIVSAVYQFMDPKDKTMENQWPVELVELRDSLKLSLSPKVRDYLADLKSNQPKRICIKNAVCYTCNMM